MFKGGPSGFMGSGGWRLPCSRLRCALCFGSLFKRCSFYAPGLPDLEQFVCVCVRADSCRRQVDLAAAGERETNVIKHQNVACDETPKQYGMSGKTLNNYCIRGQNTKIIWRELAKRQIMLGDYSTCNL